MVMVFIPLEQVATRLREAQAQHPELGHHLALQAELFTAGIPASAQTMPLNISAAEAQARLAAGQPLLHGHDLPLDWAFLRQAFMGICAIAARHRPDLASAFGGLQALAQVAPNEIEASIQHYLAPGEARGDAAGGQELMGFVLNHLLRPLLRACAERLSPHLAQGHWQQGRCPICGGAPDFAFLDEQDGSRFLLCSRCDTRWRYPRGQCPFCGTQRGVDLAYYPCGNGRYRLYTCKACGRYLKAVDLRHPGAQATPLEVARVLTVALDIAARTEGFC